MSIFANHIKIAKEAAVESLNPEVEQEVTQDAVVDVTDPLTGEPVGAPEIDPNVEPTPNDTPEAPTDIVAEEEPVEDAVIDTDTGEVAPETEEEEELDTAEDDAESEEEAALNQLIGEEAGIEALFGEIQQLSDARMAIENFGVSQSSMAIMSITGLLAGTSLEAIALESFADAGKAEADLALEALNDKAGEKSAAWSAKVLSVVKGGASKVAALVTSLFTKIGSVVKTLTSKAWDATKATGRVIKAHPVKSVLAIIAAIAAVAGVIAYATGNFPAAGAKGDAFKKFNEHIVGLINKIKSPFGKVEAYAEGAHSTLKVRWAQDSSGGFVKTLVKDSDYDPKTLGWTQSAVKSVSGQLDRVLKLIQSSIGHFGERLTKIASSAKSVGKDGLDVYMAHNEAGNNAIGATMRAKLDEGKSFRHVAAAGVVGVAGLFAVVTAMSMVIYKLIKWIVVGGVKIILGTFRALTSLVSGGDKEPATA